MPVKFVCPVCKKEKKLECVQTDARLTSEIRIEGGEVFYEPPEIHEAVLDRYQCADCGWRVPDVDTDEELVRYLETNHSVPGWEFKYRELEAVVLSMIESSDSLSYDGFARVGYSMFQNLKTLMQHANADTHLSEPLNVKFLNLIGLKRRFGAYDTDYGFELPGNSGLSLNDTYTCGRSDGKWWLYRINADGFDGQEISLFPIPSRRHLCMLFVVAGIPLPAR